MYLITTYSLGLPFTFGGAHLNAYVCHLLLTQWVVFIFMDTNMVFGMESITDQLI